MAGSIDITDEVQAAVDRLREQSLDDGTSDLRAIQGFLVRQFNLLLRERAQLEADRQRHCEYRRRLKADMESLCMISSKARADLCWERF